MRIFRTGLVALTCLFALNANAALFGDDEARRAILDLRQKVDASQQELKKVTDENAQLRRSLLDLSNQIEVLRAELAKMRGQEEQLARDVADVQRRQKDLSQGLDDRLRKFEPEKVSLDGKEFVASPEEKRDFEAALATLRKGEFAAAQGAFTGFIKRFPDSGYKPASLFWLGNAQYALRSYKEAMLNFRALIVLAPDHLRAPEAMLSIANCQLELKDAKSARKTLEDLVKTYPQSEAASVGKERLAKLK
ncbi:tol-pal system protein YbgF [Polaromonas sp.]|uniref:tol-pal system protein YbgF n=1 Tax=Polaromonas sp. TaxID=1869339 RepID=UPI002FC7E1E3